MKSYKSGLVSVVIPGYKDTYIVETIESVLNQSYKNIEIIVVDDGSPNSLRQLLSSFIDSKKIRYIYQENQKMAAARNNAIRNAEGEFIAFIDDDDLWLPNKVKEQLGYFIDENVGLVYTFAEGFNGESMVAIPNFEVAHSGKIYGEIFLQDFIANSSVMIRRSCIDTVGMFNSSTEYFGVDDCDMWTRMTYHFEARVVKSKLTKVRLHNQQFSGDRTIMVINDMRARKALINELNVPSYYEKRYYARVYFDMGYGHRSGKKLIALKYYIKSFISMPSLKVIFSILKLSLN